MEKKIASLGRPNLYDFGPEGLNWKWVNLSDLARLLGLTPIQVWRRFFGLSKDVDVIAIIAPTPDGDFHFENVGDKLEISCSYDNETGRWQYVDRSLLRSGRLFVPAGWSNAVIHAVELGVDYIRVTSWEPGQDGVEPEGTLNSACIGPFHSWYAAVGIKADNTPVWTYAECAAAGHEGQGTVALQKDLYGLREDEAMYYHVCARCGAEVYPPADEENAA